MVNAGRGGRSGGFSVESKMQYARNKPGIFVKDTANSTSSAYANM